MSLSFAVESKQELSEQIADHDLVDYAQELTSMLDSGIRFDWFDEEIKANLNGWVKAGLVAAQVKIRSLWKNSEHGYKSFADYCKRSLGKTSWYIDRLISGAEIVLQLANHGFDVLPSCEAQARHLVKASNQAGVNVVDIWDKVYLNPTFRTSNFTTDT